MKHKSTNMLDGQSQRRLKVTSRTLLLGGLAAALLATGCGPDGPKPVNPKAVVPVSGVIQLDGKPTRGIKVWLVPVPLPADRIVELPTIGKSDAEGKFQLTSYYQNDGAPAGEYGLLFEFDQNPAGSPIDLFRGKYSNPSAPAHNLSVKGDEENIDLGTINLDTK